MYPVLDTDELYTLLFNILFGAVGTYMTSYIILILSGDYGTLHSKFMMFYAQNTVPFNLLTTTGRIDNFMVAYFTGHQKTHSYDVLSVYSYIILAVSLLNILIVQFATRTYLDRQLKKHNSTEVSCNPVSYTHLTLPTILLV